MVRLERIAHNDKQTIGRITVDDTEFSCKTIELPPLNNQNNISRIPAGRYPLIKLNGDQLQWSRFSYPHFWIKDVPNRSGIKIHTANFFFQIKGCVAVGSRFTHINDDGYLDVANSKQTLERMLEAVDKNKTEIKITDEKEPTKVEVAGLINEIDEADYFWMDSLITNRS